MNVNLQTPSLTYDNQRKEYYEDFGNQLDKLYHDITAGKLGEDAKMSDFYLGRKAVKDKYPSS
tara:strand:+ start:827 stop:1015 length:189 start_codon:yes stop_codon:yes gene_type:complete